MLLLEATIFFSSREAMYVYVGLFARDRMEKLVIR